MRQTIVGVLLAAFGIFLPLSLERLMSSAPEWAWRSASFVCLLIGLLLVLLSSPAFTRLSNPRVYPLSSTLIVSLAAAVLIGGAWRLFIARPLFPLSVSAFTSDADHPPGSIIAGIPWSTKFSQLTVRIENPSGRDYERLDLLIRPDEPVAGIEQRTSVPGVSFAEAQGLTTEAVHEVGTGRVTDPMTLLATAQGYRVYCDRLQKRRHLEIVAVIARPTGQKGYAVSFASGRSIWFRGSMDGASSLGDYFAERRTATDLFIEGTYAVGDRVNEVSRHVTPGNLSLLLQDVMPRA